MAGKKKIQKIGECVYCGKNGMLTRDHIPPKGLFPEPRPHDLVTVDCCLECNQFASKDDEYFRLALSLRHDVDRDLAGPAAASALRSLGRTEQERFTRAFLSTAREINVYSNWGLYLGKAGSYDVDLERLNKVATRIVRGLYYHHFGKKLSAPCTVDAWCIDGFPIQAEGIHKIRQITQVLLCMKPTVKANGVFKYWYKAVGQPEEFSSAWYMLFFERVGFFGITVKESPNVVSTET